ncbi:MAG: RluA family pseudouridine synthase [Phycisphaerae bacterium]|nr:RluA family pseudouridine synthase [Phycisphaerae bacterium]
MDPSDQDSLRPLTLRVGDNLKDRRIDKYLHGRFGHISRRSMQEAIKAGRVRVNDRIVKCSYQVSAGERIDLVLPEPPPREITPEDIPLDVLYEDDDLIVLNKQAGIVVHPARGNRRGTLVNALVHYADRLSSGLGEFRPGIVHRLDRNTTGVMVVAKTDTAQWRIATQFERRQVEKVYLAIVHGTPPLDADRINAPLGVHPTIREKHAIRPESGKQAVTAYKVLEAFRGFSLLQLTPKTGRTHQIRVHLSYVKHPVVADQTYGGKQVYPWQLRDGEPAVEEPVIARCALHAFQIGFTHPTTGQQVHFEAPLAPDMQALLEMLRQYRKGS